MQTIFNAWLPRFQRNHWTVNGIEISPETRTRQEEYYWALQHTEGNEILDAATGYVNTWHMLPYILVNGYPERHVTTIDANEGTLKMPPHPQVTRHVGDITKLPFEDNSFDTVCCISVLEHLNDADRELAAKEFLRVARNRLVLTADFGDAALPKLFGLPVGSTLVQTQHFPHLNPPVYALCLDLLPAEL